MLISDIEPLSVIHSQTNNSKIKKKYFVMP